MRIALVEDESFWREKISAFLRKSLPEADLVCYENGEEFLRGVPESDLVLMDVEMPGPDGFETARLFTARGGDSPVVILTTHTELGREGYKVGAFRYVDKLAMEEELGEALDSIAALRGGTGRVPVILRDGETAYIRLEEIIYGESLGRNLCLHAGGRTLILREGIGRMEELLPKDDFFVCHKSFFVGWKYVKNVGECDITMSDGTKIPLTRRKRSLAREAYLEYAWLRAGR